MHHTAVNATSTTAPMSTDAAGPVRQQQQHQVATHAHASVLPPLKTTTGTAAYNQQQLFHAHSHSHSHSHSRSHSHSHSHSRSMSQPQHHYYQSQQRCDALPPSSQDTIAETVFSTPAASQESNIHADSSQPLHQLSTLAATREKMADPSSPNAGLSRKRMRDGAVKHTRDHSSTSPVYPAVPRVESHSRTTSAVSAISTELKARLSYAMVKVQKGWQSRSIDEVESLATHAASGSPTSSNSTLHVRQGSSSASPSMPYSASQPLPNDHAWKNSNSPSVSPPVPTSSAPHAPHSSLAPPAPIHACRVPANARRNSRNKYAPSHLSHSHQASPSGAAYSPSQPSPMQTTAAQRDVDPILFSPSQNAREAEAIESLLCMGSPGNTQTLSQNYPPQMGPPQQRTALPSSRLSQSQEASAPPPRKSLPTGRPQPAPKKVGFEKSEMDLDSPYHASPRGISGLRGTPRRKLNGGGQALRPLPVSSGLSGPNRPRPKLGDDDIEKMLDRAATCDSSDSEGDIELPTRTPRVGVVGI